MPWGYAAAAVGTIVGASMSSGAVDDAAALEAEGTQAGIESQERMFREQLALQEPYREAGYSALTGLQDLTSASGRASALSDYYGSDEFGAMSAQQEEQTLRNSAVTGGMRSGNNQVALASIAPQLGQQYLSNKYNQLTGLANMGQGAASQGVQGAQFLGAQTSNLLQQQGQSQAQGSLAQANIWGNALGTLGGIGMNYFNQPQQAGVQ